jgi:putative endonuclease
MVKPFYVYMLECSDRSFYVGHTDDLQTRLAQHESGALGGHTSTRRPVRLVWFEEQPTRDEALRSELQLKGWSRAKKRALVVGDWAAIKRLARGPDRSSFRSGRGAAPSFVRPERSASSFVRPGRTTSSFDSGPACGGPYAQDEREGDGGPAGHGPYGQDEREGERPSPTVRKAVHPERSVSFDSGPARGGPYAQDEREGEIPPGFPKKSVRPERSGRAAAAESKGGGHPDA